MPVFDNLTSPDATVFYQRNDPNDMRLGEAVHIESNAYAFANVVLIGCPQDEGVRRNKGRIGASQAPDEIRRALYRLVAPDNPNFVLFDAGNTRIQPNLEETHTLHSNIIRQFIQDGKRVISLGGGNDLAYADVVGLAQVMPDILAINLDAHFDVRADEIRNSGTPYRQLLEEGHLPASNFYEVGNMPMVNAPTYTRYLENKGAHIIPLATLQSQGILQTFDTILKHPSEAIFWGLDMDVVHVADAPGVSASNTLGISAHDFCQIASIAGSDNRSRLFEITEVNPIYDIDGRTSRLAAVAIYNFLTHLNL
jgi:formiminoglutamase